MKLGEFLGSAGGKVSIVVGTLAAIAGLWVFRPSLTFDATLRTDKEGSGQPEVRMLNGGQISAMHVRFSCLYKVKPVLTAYRPTRFVSGGMDANTGHSPGDQPVPVIDEIAPGDSNEQPCNGHLTSTPGLQFDPQQTIDVTAKYGSIIPFLSYSRTDRFVSDVENGGIVGWKRCPGGRANLTFAGCVEPEDLKPGSPLLNSEG